MGQGSPEALVDAFVSAWNAHDMEALASLFRADADFVNVVGIWWKDRAQIEAGHAFAHRSFFRNSALQADAVSVKALTAEVATVHVRWTLSGQEEPDGSTGQTRSGILLFVATRGTAGWEIAAAQNTDVQPGVLTVAAGGS